MNFNISASTYNMSLSDEGSESKMVKYFVLLVTFRGEASGIFVTNKKHAYNFSTSSTVNDL